MKTAFKALGHGFGPRGDSRLELTVGANFVKGMEHAQVNMALREFGPIPAGMQLFPTGDATCMIRYAPRYDNDPSEITILSKDVLMDICKRFVDAVDNQREDAQAIRTFMDKAKNLKFSPSVGLSQELGEVYIDLGIYGDSCKEFRPELATEEFQNCYSYSNHRLEGKPSEITKMSDEELFALRETLLDKILEDSYMDVAGDKIRTLNGMYKVFGKIDKNAKKIVVECLSNGQFRREIPFKNGKDLYDMSKTLDSVWKVYELEAGVFIPEPTPAEQEAEAKRQAQYREERLVEERKLRKAKKDLENQWEALIGDFRSGKQTP